MNLPIVEVERSDLGDVGAEAAVHARAFNAQRDAQVDRCPIRICALPPQSIPFCVSCVSCHASHRCVVCTFLPAVGTHVVAGSLGDVEQEILAVLPAFERVLVLGNVQRSHIQLRARLSGALCVRLARISDQAHEWR